MGWLSQRRARTRRSSRSGRSQPIDDATVGYLTEFVRTHRGVEAFIEPQTVVTQTTVLLIAYDGQWTRRRVPSPEWARSFAEHLQIPGYDAAVVGYPQRMRDYNHRQRIEARRQTEGS
jgi:hypothetical protein